MDAVVVAPAHPRAGDVALGHQVGDDPVGRPFGDAHAFGDVAQRGVRPPRHLKQDMRVVGQEDPPGAGSAAALICLAPRTCAPQVAVPRLSDRDARAIREAGLQAWCESSPASVFQERFGACAISLSPPQTSHRATSRRCSRGTRPSRRARDGDGGPGFQLARPPPRLELAEGWVLIGVTIGAERGGIGPHMSRPSRSSRDGSAPETSDDALGTKVVPHAASSCYPAAIPCGGGPRSRRARRDHCRA